MFPAVYGFVNWLIFKSYSFLLIQKTSLIYLLSLIFTLPDYQEKYQELLEREDLFPYYEENGADLSGHGELYVFFFNDVFF